MSRDWAAAPLSELAVIEKSLIDPSRLSDLRVRLFSIPAFDNGGPSIESPTEIKSGKLGFAHDAVLFSKLNPHIPRVWWPRPDQAMVNLASTEFVPLRATNRVLPGFLYQLVRSPAFLAEASARVKGTTGSHQRVDVGSLMDARFPVPPLDEQWRIAEVLGALDDLIDTNQRLGLSLTEAASAFGQLLLLKIGSGEPRSIEDIATITKGYSYKSAELVEGDGWLVGLKNVGRHGVFRPDGFKPLSAKVKPTHVVDNGDLVVAQTDLTQAREVIGRPVRVRRGGREGVLVASLDLAIVRPLEGVPGQFIQSVLESVEFRDHVLGFCNGTTVLHMGARAIPSFPVVLPDAEFLERFEALVPLRDAADEAFETAETLRSTRDELLPLLMSGKVRVKPERVAA